jgi:hypothetical protein
VQSYAISFHLYIKLIASPLSYLPFLYTTQHKMNRISAPLLALFYLALVYASIIHLFVLWKWQTSPEIAALFVQEEYDELAEIPEPTDSIPGVPDQDVIDTLKIKGGFAFKSGQVLEEVAQEVIKNIATLHSRFMAWDSDKDFLARTSPGASLLSEGTAAFPELQITSLLEKASLSEIQESMLQLALQELDEITLQKMQVQWKLIFQSLVPPENATTTASIGPFPAKEKLSEEDIVHMVCSADNEEVDVNDDEKASALAEDQDLSLYAQDDDLKELVMDLKRLLHKREKHLRKYLDATIVSKTFETFTQELKTDLNEAKTYVHSLIEEMVAALQAAVAANSATGNAGCIAEEHVMALVEEGLNTLQRRGDLRDALLQKLKEIDPDSATNLILDAVLETRSPLPELRPLGTINARRFVDTPLLRHLAGGIDLVSDWIRHYTDLFDDYVDKQAFKAGIRRNGASSGEIVVTRILQVTGTIQIPVPNQAQQLLMRSKLGQDLLAS